MSLSSAALSSSRAELSASSNPVEAFSSTASTPAVSRAIDKVLERGGIGWSGGFSFAGPRPARRDFMSRRAPGHAGSMQTETSTKASPNDAWSNCGQARWAD